MPINTCNIDPEVPNWTEINLPNTIVEQNGAGKPRAPRDLLRLFFGNKKSVILPDGMPGKDMLPKYLLQEFHSIPNGNYSKTFSMGYIKGFDLLMLGTMRHARNHITSFFAGSASVLDLGCGGGRTAGSIADSGVKDVWGIDPSPYHLKHAAAKFPAVKFIQGVAENNIFSDKRFDGVAVCFLFHELPPKVTKQTLLECKRILKDGGRLMICEPSPTQWYNSYWRLFKEFGLKGIYFKLLANSVHEPFVQLWHATDVRKLLTECGFRLLSDNDNMPFRFLACVKQ